MTTTPPERRSRTSGTSTPGPARCQMGGDCRPGGPYCPYHAELRQQLLVWEADAASQLAEIQRRLRDEFADDRS